MEVNELIERLRELRDFLDGGCPMDNHWFGESHPDRVGLYWWRRRMKADLTEAADRIAALEDALRRIEAEDSEEVPVKHGWCFYSDEPYTTPAHTKHGPFAQIARAVLKGDA